MEKLAKFGAVAFGLWGLMHIVGALVIIASVYRGGAGAGYGIYGYSGGDLPDVTGAVLSYFGYLIGMSGIAVTGIAVRWNWTNSEVGLAINTGLTVLIDIGLIVFLMRPGYISFAEAAPGFVLVILGVTLGGIACRKAPAHG